MRYPETLMAIKEQTQRDVCEVKETKYAPKFVEKQAELEVILNRLTNK